MPRIINADRTVDLANLLEDVARGEEFIIVRENVPVARLTKFNGIAKQEETAKIIDRITRRASQLKLGGMPWKVLRDEGRDH